MTRLSNSTSVRTPSRRGSVRLPSLSHAGRLRHEKLSDTRKKRKRSGLFVFSSLFLCSTITHAAKSSVAPAATLMIRFRFPQHVNMPQFRRHAVNHTSTDALPTGPSRPSGFGGCEQTSAALIRLQRPRTCETCAYIRASFITQRRVLAGMDKVRRRSIERQDGSTQRGTSVGTEFAASTLVSRLSTSSSVTAYCSLLTFASLCASPTVIDRRGGREEGAGR